MKMNPTSILIVDDDELYRAQIQLILKDYGQLTLCKNQKEAFEALDNQHFDLAIVDLNLPDELAGFKVLAKAKLKNTHVIILSSEDCEEIFEDAYNLGCEHFLSKHNFHHSLKESVERFIKNDKNKLLENFIENEYFTQDTELISSIQELTKLNLKKINVFLSGPTGCGKTFLAKFIHTLSHGEESPFIHLNCSEMSENLLESELFGHIKGAFTGASENKKGKLQLAHNGTLFLDEVTTMSVPMQQKLLKAIEEKEFYPVGSSKSVRSNFTVVCATCEDIFLKVQKELFRKDLFFRINGHHIEMKSLVHRKGDIQHIIKKWLKSSPRKFVIKNSAFTALEDYSWPGNIRELKKIFTIMQHSENGIIEAANLPLYIQNNMAYFESESYALTETQKQFIQKNGLRKFISEIEKQIVNELYQKNNGKVTKCIKELKISNSAFYRILETPSQ